MPAQSFEYKFSQLADSQLGEKAPSLVRYKVGFQILDKNEEETKAVGIMAFVINSVWVYMPIFFMEGGLAGMDIMYLKPNDTFVPAIGAWIAAIKAQGESLLGKVTEEVKDDDGVMMVSDAELNVEKTASANSIISPEELRSMFRINKSASSTDLIHNLGLLGKEAVGTFVRSLNKSPDFANAVLRYYSPDDLQKVAQVVAEVEFKETKPKTQEVTVITETSDPEAKNLDESEKKILMRNGMYVKDGRKTFSKLFRQTIQNDTYQNPNYSGLYEVLMRDGTTRNMIVLVLPVAQFCTKYNKPAAKVALIDFDNPVYYYIRPILEVFGKVVDNMSLSKDKGKVGGIKATNTALKNYAKPSGLLFAQGASKVIEGCLDYECAWGGDISLITLNTEDRNDNVYSVNGCNYEVVFTGKEGKLCVKGNGVYVPEDARIFLAAPWEKNKKLNLGTLDTIYSALVKEASLQTLNVYNHGNMTQIVSGKGVTGMLDKTAAVKHLTLVEGLFAGQAQQILKEASRKRDRAAKYFIQYAAPFINKYAATDETFTESKVGGAALSPSDNLPQEAIDKVTRASEAGIKEVFDVKVLKSLIEVADVAELRKDYIMDMIKGMDRTGRMLFLYYWHNEEFANRYGEDDMNQLADTLKQVFISTGDLVLFLKEKMADSPDSPESLFGFISVSIGGADVEKAGY